MELLNPLQSRSEALNQAHNTACDLLGIEELMREEAREWDFVIHKVSDLMIDRLKGRTKPIRKSKLSTHKEMGREKSLFGGTYPLKLKNDLERLRYLQDLFKTEGITLEIYMDLSELLKVPKKERFDIDIGLEFD